MKTTQQQPTEPLFSGDSSTHAARVQAWLSQPLEDLEAPPTEEELRLVATGQIDTFEGSLLSELIADSPEAQARLEEIRNEGLKIG